MRINQAGPSSTPRADLSSSTQRSVLKRKSLVTFETKERKRKARKPGTVAIKQIKYYQSTTDNLLPRAPFQRLIREIVSSYRLDDSTEIRWHPAAMQVLQFATEAYMIALYDDANKAAIHAKRVTIRPDDMRFIKAVRGTVNPYELF